MSESPQGMGMGIGCDRDRLVGRFAHNGSVQRIGGLFSRVFVGNFIGYSADPANYFSVSGASSSGDSSASFYLEKTLSKNSSISVLAGIERLDIETGSAAGWDNVSFSYKHTILSVPTH